MTSFEVWHFHSSFLILKKPPPRAHSSSVVRINIPLQFGSVVTQIPPPWTHSHSLFNLSGVINLIDCAEPEVSKCCCYFTINWRLRFISTMSQDELTHLSQPSQFTALWVFVEESGFRHSSQSLLQSPISFQPKLHLNPAQPVALPSLFMPPSSLPLICGFNRKLWPAAFPRRKEEISIIHGLSQALFPAPTSAAAAAAESWILLLAQTGSWAYWETLCQQLFSTIMGRNEKCFLLCVTVSRIYLSWTGFITESTLCSKPTSHLIRTEQIFWTQLKDWRHFSENKLSSGMLA